MNFGEANCELLVAGSASISSQQSQPQIDSLQCVSAQPATVVMQHYEYSYETHAYLPIYFAVTLYVHTDPDSLPSFAEECSFGN